MGKYTVRNGQNLFDVSLHIYGSIEGVTDLMMNNENLSLAAELKAGDELIFTDGFVISKDITAYFKANGIIPANGERRVYPKTASFPLIAAIRLSPEETSAGFSVSGTGVMEIDWGDNSPLEEVVLSNEVQHTGHYFDNRVSSHRKIRIYGSLSIKQVDFTLFHAGSVRFLSPVNTEKFILRDSRLDIGFINLLEGVYDIDLSGTKTPDLRPLLSCKKLMNLDLSGANLSRTVLDDYLISLVKQHYGRRNCTVILTDTPSGEYREPERDINMNYVLSSGMEAVWVLVNEESWNEGGYWKFIINDKVYCGL